MKVRESWWDRQNRGIYKCGVVDLDNGTTVQVLESPTGRSVQVHVLDKTGWRKVYP